MDFPGHYCRIKSVAVSVPCIVGPHTGMSATLTLLDHSYRTDDSASSSADYPRKQGDDGSNPRFHTDRIPIQAISLSIGQQDSGVFELNFRDERYMPFEGAGAISSWRLELPNVVKQFDYNSISDVILQVRYTAINGGGVLKKAASDTVKDFVLKSGGGGQSTVFDLKNKFANEWRMLSAQQSGTSGDFKFAMQLMDLKGRLPYWARQSSPTAKKVVLLVATDSKGANGAKTVSATIDKISLSVAGGDDITLQTGSALGGWSVFETSRSDGVDLADWTLGFHTATQNSKLSYTRAALIVGYSVVLAP